MGLEGESPESIETKTIPARIKYIYENGELNLNVSQKITFHPTKHLNFHFTESLQRHPNGMRITGSCLIFLLTAAYNKEGDMIATNEYYSRVCCK